MTAKDAWNGDKDYLFHVGSWLDSYYNKQEDQNSLSGITVMLNEMVVQAKSRTQPECHGSRAGGCHGDCAVHDICVTVAHFHRAEGSPTNGPQNGQFGRVRHYQLMECGRANVPCGCVHVFKEEGILEVHWIPTDENNSDLFTKNLDGPTFAKHALVYVGAQFL